MAGLLAVLTWAPAAPAAQPLPHDVRAADTLAQTPPGRERDRALAGWAARAPLAELMYVLRRPAPELGGAEAPLAEAALKQVPASRAALRHRLTLRLAVADPRHSRRWLASLTPDAVPSRPGASAFRIAALIPDQGDYASFGLALKLGLEAGLAQHNATATLPVDLVVWPTHDGAPERVAAALDSAALGSAVIVGELLDASTAAVATGARLARLVMISPVATDEEIGAIAPTIFQIGPTGLQRGAALARAVIPPGGSKLGVLLSGRHERGAFARGFVAEAESLGAAVVWRGTYAPGTEGFRDATRALLEKGVELLFWDGEAREAEALLVQLAEMHAPVQLCGGAELDPEAFHAPHRSLLEGARFVAEDWQLSDASQAVLDSLVRARGETPNRLHTRGYLAGRLVADAVEGGALCPEEIAAALAARVGDEPYLRRRGFMAWKPSEATLPIYVVKDGRTVAVSRP